MNAAAPKKDSGEVKDDGKNTAAKTVAAAEEKAKKIVADAEAKAEAIVKEAQADAENVKSGEVSPDSSVNDKFNALWAQINDEYEDDELKTTVLARLESLQFAAKELDD